MKFALIALIATASAVRVSSMTAHPRDLEDKLTPKMIFEKCAALDESGDDEILTKKEIMMCIAGTFPADLTPEQKQAAALRIRKKLDAEWKKAGFVDGEGINVEQLGVAMAKAEE